METLEQWVLLMSSWCYLQPIFDSADIMKQLPQETKRFKGVDIKWRYIMNLCKESPGILENCTKDTYKESFIEANKNLEMVQKGLSEYLERKRSSFARFYFLSDDELLEILSQTKEVRKVRSHLRKVFEAIADLEFKADDSMVAMMSVEGEKIDFLRKVDPVGKNVEFWMGDVERQMIASVRHVFMTGLTEYREQDRNHWMITHAG
jgi:dynein heavy chain